MNAYQEVAVNSLRNSIPKGSRLKALAYAPDPAPPLGTAPSVNVSRTIEIDGREEVQTFKVDPQGRLV